MSNPETIATYMSDGVKVRFSRPFKSMYPKYLKEVKYLESLGDDFNLLFYPYSQRKPLALAGG